ncbi:MAG: PKD domain-containing protein [Planctomycetota bacterium]|nr:PKD domain-containing protein [Planctomycetota bacterium]
MINPICSADKPGLFSRYLLNILIIIIIIFASHLQSAFSQDDYKPDALIKEKSVTGTPPAYGYIGDNVFYPTQQMTTHSVVNNQMAIYYIKLQNDGFAPRTYSVSGSAGDANWIVSYYNRETVGDDITSFILSGDWFTTHSIPPYDSETIRVEITPTSAVEGGSVFDVEIILSDRVYRIDKVSARTTCTAIYKPDIQIRKSTVLTYTGNNIYEYTGLSQTISTNINNTMVVTYYIKLENDGNVGMGFSVTGTGEGGGWVVEYYDALSGGNNITTAVIGQGWLSSVLSRSASQEIRVEVSPGLSVRGSSQRTVYIGIRAGLSVDVARTINTCIQGAVVELDYGTAHPPATYEFKDTPKLSVLQFTLGVLSGYEGVNVNKLMISAGGSGNDATAISAVSLVRDANANGFYDIDEQVFGSARYLSDDSTVELVLNPSQFIPVGSRENFLVVYQMAGSASISHTFFARLTAIEIKTQYSMLTIVPANLPLSSFTKTISDYISSMTSGYAPLRVDFFLPGLLPSGGQIGTITSVALYEWDFNYDGVTFRPQHRSIFSGDGSFVYTMAGGFNVRLVVTYLDGGTISRNFTITVSPSQDSPSVSAIVISPASTGSAPFSVTLLAEAVPNAFGIGSIIAYHWDFDSNGVIDLTTALSYVNWTYNMAGDYWTECRVQNTAGLVAKNTSGRIRVFSSSVSPPEVSIDLPSGQITIQTGDNVLFWGSGEPRAAGGVIAKYEWDFDGDDRFDLVDTVMSKTLYTYLYPGRYNVKLRVTETSGPAPAGLSAETTRTIVVLPSLTPRVVITQAGKFRPNKDGLREDVDGGNLSINVIPICPGQINRINLRYRRVDYVLPDTFYSPDHDPPEIVSDTWKTIRLSKSLLYPSEISREGFLVGLNFRWLSVDWWYEVVAVVNLSPVDGTFDYWNASSTAHRVFLKNVYTSSPEIQEITVSQTIRTVLRRENTITTKNDTTVFIPAETLSVTKDTLFIDTSTTVISPQSGLTFVGIYRDIRTNSLVRNSVCIKIGYRDDDRNGIVDGTDISERTLLIYRYDVVLARWLPLLNQSVDRYNNTVLGWTSGWGTFGLTGRLSAEEEGLTTSGSSGFQVQRDWAFCFIASAVYGSQNVEEVEILRQFRDKHLLTSAVGRSLVRVYYKVSPPMAKYIAQRPALRFVVRQMLRPVVYLLE